MKIAQRTTFLFTFLVLQVVGGCGYLPGEFEPMDRLWYSSPTYNNVSWAETLDVQVAMIAAQLNGGDAVEVVVNPDDPDFDPLGATPAEYTARLAAAGVTDFSKLTFVEVVHSDIWARDNLPLVLKMTQDPRDSANFHNLTTAQQAIVLERMAHIPLGYAGDVAIDVIFDGWGYAPFSSVETAALYSEDDKIIPQIAANMGIPVISSPIVAEGGGIESNGEGTVFYAEAAFLQRQLYNPTGPGGQPMTAAQIRDEIAAITLSPNAIGVPFFHPLDGHSVLDGPLYADINGDGVDEAVHLPFTVRHTDEVMKIVDANTILVAQLPQSAVTNAIEQQVHDTLADLKAWLALQVDQDGNPFTLVDYPDPGLTVYELTDGDDIWWFLGELAEDWGNTNGVVLQDYDPDGGYMASAGTYINFSVTNNVVLVPQFWEVGGNPRLLDTDAEAIAIAQAYHPNHTVVGVRTEAINLGGGGPHCITMHLPE